MCIETFVRISRLAGEGRILPRSRLSHPNPAINPAPGYCIQSGSFRGALRRRADGAWNEDLPFKTYLPFLQPYFAEGCRPVPLVHLFGRRAVRAGGSTGAAPPSSYGAAPAAGAAVNRNCKDDAFLGVARHPDAVPITGSRSAPPRFTSGMPDFAARCVEGHVRTTLKLDELIRTQDILLDMQADRKRTALRAMAVRLGERVGASPDAVLAALLRRERLGSTAIGNGVAIPHARLDEISAPAAVFARLQHPVSFGTPDDNPVDLLLALLWPKSDTRAFVTTLLDVWRLLRRPGLAELLRKSGTPAEAYGWIRLQMSDAGPTDALHGVHGPQPARSFRR